MAAPLAATHPAAVLVTLVAAACVLVSVSFRLYDADAWQHLAFGRALWTTHAIPRTQTFIWSDYGAPLINPSWGFSALLWPFWLLGGVTGLFVWRWLTTLSVFALLWLASRRLGARGFTALLVMVVCSLVYRQRSQIRPETLASLWFALTVWLLESRRASGGTAVGRAWWLVAVAWAWANSHVTYYLCFVVLGFHLLDVHLAGRTGDGRAARRLWLVALAMVAVVFVNPYGWRALVRPFEYALRLRHEPMMQSISELKPVDWSIQRANGLPLLIVGWPLLALWRWRRQGLDRVELLMCAAFTTLGLSSGRFVGGYALAAAPYVARDLDGLAGGWLRGRVPTWPRAALASLACVALGWTEWTRFQGPIGIGFDLRHTPQHACDFMAAHGVRGRGFNHFYLGGAMLHRFWPERERLPFVDIHPEDWPGEVRDLYHRSLSSPDGWRALDGRYRFDYALMSRRYLERYGLLDLLDEEPRWARVFVDDVAAVYVRRDGPLSAVADTFGYRLLPGGRARLANLMRRAAEDPVVRAELRADLERQAQASPMNFYGRQLLRALPGGPGP